MQAKVAEFSQSARVGASITLGQKHEREVKIKANNKAACWVLGDHPRVIHNAASPSVMANGFLSAERYTGLLPLGVKDTAGCSCS